MLHQRSVRTREQTGNCNLLGYYRPGRTFPRSSSLSDYCVAVVTFAAGFGALAILSLKAHTFSLFHPTVKFPLMVLPSVFFGDSILLPIFNARLVHFMRVYVRYYNFGRLTTYVSYTVVILSLLGNLYLHQWWITGQSTVFTRAESGDLSTAGRWHFVFSTAETSLVLLFLWTWLKTFSDYNSMLIRLGMTTWAVFVYFSLLSFGDWLMRDFYIFRMHSVSQALSVDYLFILFPSACMLIMGVAYCSAYRIL